MQRDEKITELAGTNPLMALWMAPMLVANCWLRVFMGTLPRTEETDKGSPGRGQLKVPRVLQESKDRDLFA